jgi:hypothetical protein
VIGNRKLDEVRIADDSALRFYPFLLTVQVHPPRQIANNQAPKSAVADQDVGAQPEQKPRRFEHPCYFDGQFELAASVDFHQKVCGASNTERGQRTERDVPADMIFSETLSEGPGEPFEIVALLSQGLTPGLHGNWLSNGAATPEYRARTSAGATSASASRCQVGDVDTRQGLTAERY